MDYAAMRGNSDVVQWLHRNRTEGCTRHAVEWAASNGHVEIVQWSFENLSEHDATMVLVRAASNYPDHCPLDRQLAMLQWIYENRDDACTSCALKTLIERWGWDSVQLTSLRWFREHPSTAPCTGRCGGHVHELHWIGRSAAQGDLQLLEYVMEHFPETEPPGELLTLVDPLTSRGKDTHSGVVTWVQARQRERDDQDHTGGFLGLSQRCSIM